MKVVNRVERDIRIKGSKVVKKCERESRKLKGR